MRGYGGISKLQADAARRRIEDFQRADMDPATLAEQIRRQEKAEREAEADYRRVMDAIWAAIPITLVAWLVFFCLFNYFYR
jgi:siroheme synthase (precorrin-2 oxidase/ferrochelatase)